MWRHTHPYKNELSLSVELRKWKHVCLGQRHTRNETLLSASRLAKSHLLRHCLRLESLRRSDNERLSLPLGSHRRAWTRINEFERGLSHSKAKRD